MQPYIIHLKKKKCVCLTCSFIVEFFSVGFFFVFFSPYTLVLLQQLCMFLCVLHLLLTVVACSVCFCFVLVMFFFIAAIINMLFATETITKYLHYF